MKKVYTVIALLFIAFASNATTYTLGSGKWSDQKLGSIIAINDMVIITGQMIMNSSIVVHGTLQVDKGAGMVGMKDLVIAKGGMFVNNGNTVMKNIINEGTIHNNMTLEAMMNIENKSVIENNNNLVAGNNFSNFGGNGSGKGGAYFINNSISVSPTAKFSPLVNVYYGNLLETEPAVTSAMNLSVFVNVSGVQLRIENANGKEVDFFTIERSEDGKNYTLLDMLKNTNDQMVYTDNNTTSGFTYYRVKAINLKGEEIILPLATVKAPSTGFAMAR